MEKTQTEKEKCYKQFICLFNRIINFSSLRKQKIVDKSWEQVYGEYFRSRGAIGGGWTPADTRFCTKLRFENVINRPHDIYKILYFNPDQLALLTTKELLHVVFFSDFGSGNILCMYNYILVHRGIDYKLRIII